MACGCVSVCRACGARILWAVVGPEKQTTPLDAAAVVGGTIRLSDKGASVLTPDEQAQFRGPTYQQHDCPRRRP